jgi:hypothetical protein
MRALLILLASLGVGTAAWAGDTVNPVGVVNAGDCKVLKVLSFLVDQKGRIAVSPSLFDRDAYQAYLRQHLGEVSTVRVDVLWKAVKAPDEKLRISVDLRGLTTNGVPKIYTLETNVAPGRFGRWTSLELGSETYRDCGSVLAWRARLWNKDEMLSEQKSFLW